MSFHIFENSAETEERLSKTIDEENARKKFKTHIQSACCEGKERHPGDCLKNRCPHYLKAKKCVERAHPYVGTGFGNLYPEPKHTDFLNQVLRTLKA